MTSKADPLVTYSLEGFDEDMRAICIELLGLEIRRSQYNVLLDPPLFAVRAQYGADIAEATRALKLARQDLQLSPAELNLPHHWLTLLGHRLAAERGFACNGLKAARFTACKTLDLPSREVDAWSVARLFQRYMDTELRAEWDYPGLQFHYPRMSLPAHTAI